MAESLEVAALRNLAAAVGARVTDTITPGVHSATSYHYALGTGGTGLAIDLAEAAPSHDTAGLARINQAVAVAIGPHCAELIYAGPGAITLRNGQPYRYSADVLAAHHNHVHVAVNRGFRFEPPKEATVPDAAPDYAVLSEPVSISITPSGNGYIILCADGGVFAFGDAKYLGRVHKTS